ncbi:Glycogenin-1 [Echinococcus granulosus]|uniref:glycogenin glucosyltransferase n=1 Tax=Echinococcus granulosus TaxID=6210 RepID=W6V1N2_ECHGR|nr:Glycogenin-1 [Echinococcus granulosus]EUB64857.1 Glycogenin-1 [Echinococcus granulosus]
MSCPNANERHSYVTLATNDEYAIGALVLGYSLRRAGTNKEMAILITEGVSHGFREILEGVYDSVIVVKPLQSLDEHNLKLLRRLNLGITYTKLYCWKLIQFSKCVFLDADTISDFHGTGSLNNCFLTTVTFSRNGNIE